jgi:PAS domain S-box-containing protein
MPRKKAPARPAAAAGLSGTVERRFRSIFEQAPFAIEVYDATGLLLEVNRACLEIFGVVDADELRGFNLFADPNIRPALLTRLRRRETVRYECDFNFDTVRKRKLYRTRRRGVRRLAVIITPFAAGPRSPVEGYLVMVHDLTGVRKAEAALAVSEERFRLVLDNSPVVVWQQDSDLRYTWIHNPAPGFEARNILGRTDEDLFTGDQAMLFTALKKRVLVTGKPDRAEVTDTIDGRTYVHDMIVQPVRDGGGRVAGLRGIATDITNRKKAEDALRRAHGELENRVRERTAQLSRANTRLKTQIRTRRKAEKALRESEESYRTLMANSTEGIARFTAEVPIPVTLPEDEQVEMFFRHVVLTECNEAYARLYGVVSPGELAGLRLSDTIDRSDPRIDGAARAFIRSGYRLRDVETPETDLQGNIRFFSSGLSGTVENDHLTGLWTVQRDITERRKTDEALRDSARQLRHLSSELLAAQEKERRRVSRELHDSIGQTLTAIKFGLEKITRRVAGEEPRADVPKLLAEAVSMVRGAIREVRGITAALRPTILDELGIVATITWFCGEFRRMHEGIRVEKRIAVDEGVIPSYLKIVIFRLLQEALNNAAKHSGADRIRVILRRRGKGLEFLVEDNGHGFEMRRGRGGLGLLGMRERTELTGGVFAVEKGKRGGTVVRASWEPLDLTL